MKATQKTSKSKTKKKVGVAVDKDALLRRRFPDSARTADEEAAYSLAEAAYAAAVAAYIGPESTERFDDTAYSLAAAAYAPLQPKTSTKPTTLTSTSGTWRPATHTSPSPPGTLNNTPILPLALPTMLFGAPTERGGSRETVETRPAPRR
ncbi:MAG: hypothetical protein Q8O67_31660 [Deltaproteobacteria bacterium]|nr:hypothetical protein [Deltaproteobacteria bacterium]